MLLNKVDCPLDIIVMAGQSNAEGYGIGPTSEPYMPTPDILMMRDTDNQGYVVDEKTHGTLGITMPRNYLIGIAEERCSTSGKIGNLGLYFARKYREEHPNSNRRILVIQTAVGATGFAKGNWTKDGVLYLRMLEMISTALGMNPENRLVGVLWHQGEHDAIFKPKLTDEEREEFYFSNLSSLISGLRGSFGTVPFIMGEFTDEWSASCPRSCVIISAMKRLVKSLPAVDITSSAGLLTNNQALGNGDLYHFSRDSLRILGERYVDVYNELVK